MMCIPCNDPTYIYEYNPSILVNAKVPHSTLKKKSSYIAYHCVREGSTRDEWYITYVNTLWNPTDMLTNPLSSGEEMKRFI